MSDVLPLPPRPNLEQYQKLARDFQKSCKSGDPGAVHDWAARWAETLARLQGRAITPEVKREIGWDIERIERQSEPRLAAIAGTHAHPEMGSECRAVLFPEDRVGPSG